VTLVDRDAALAQETHDMIVADGGQAMVIGADVTDSAACAAIVRATIDRFGRLDILVNNVGVSGGDDLARLDEARWSALMDGNLKTCVLMTKHAIEPLVASGRGAIVNISSTAALLASGGAYAYGPAKAAVIAFTREVAVKYGRQGVRANVICPGHIVTPHVAGFFDEAAFEKRRKIAPLGTVGDAWDVANAAVFLASDESSFITAQCLAVDGGVTQTMQMTAAGLLDS
jgi:NAD(P)-dependent dehydrogenase (short-subunit alcohol dehydrogenase family)